MKFAQISLVLAVNTTGTNHAGNNADVILANRTTDESVIAMMDASPSNIPKKMDAELTARFILCFCLVHGKRKFFEVFGAFDKECDFVLELIGQVFANDAYCKDTKLSPLAPAMESTPMII